MGRASPDRDELLGRLRRVVEQIRSDRVSDVRAADEELLRQISRRFGSWTAARDALGITAEQRARWKAARPRRPRQRAPRPTVTSARLQAHDGHHIDVLWGENESVDHWVLKLLSIQMLVGEGYSVRDIKLEHEQILDGRTFRADVFVDGERPVWVECRECPPDKLEYIRHRSQARLLHVRPWWWASTEQWGALHAEELRWHDPLGHNCERAKSFGLVPGVETWHCDLRSPPEWGLVLGDDGRLRFLDGRKAGSRDPVLLWKSLWLTHERQSGRNPYVIEPCAPDDRFVPGEGLLNAFGGIPAAVEDVMRRLGENLDDPREIRLAVALLLSWSFSPDSIVHREWTIVGGRRRLPYLRAEGLPGRIWVERYSHDAETLARVGRDFGGRVVVLFDEAFSLKLGPGIEYWHVAAGRPTGWGLRADATGHIRVIRAPVATALPWLVVDSFVARFGLPDWSPELDTSCQPASGGGGQSGF